MLKIMNMKNFLAAMFALGILGTSFAGIKFDKHVIEDNIPLGTLDYDFVFKFRNDGETSVRLQSVKTDCGCAVANANKDTYLPGETGEIKGKFRAGNMSGKQEKNIYIETDNLAQPKINLLLRLQVEPMIAIKPALLYWKINGDAAEKSVSVNINPKVSFDAVSVHSDNENFKVAVVPDEKNVQRFALKVRPTVTTHSARGLIKIKACLDEKETSYFVHAIVK